MKDFTNKPKYSFSISETAINRANKIRKLQVNDKKGLDVYTKILCIDALNTYLKSLGYQTDLESSSGWNPLMLSLQDSADIDLLNVGSIGCIPVRSDKTSFQIPLESISERVAYIFIQLDNLFKTANIVGFVPNTNKYEVSVSEIQSSDEIPKFLRNLSNIIPLHKWSKTTAPLGWKPVRLADDQFNNSSGNIIAASNHDIPDIINHKQIKFKNINRVVDLYLGYREIENYFKIFIEVKNPKESQGHFLPKNLEICMASKTGEVYDKIKIKKDKNNVRLNPISMEKGSIFNIILSIDANSYLEDIQI